MDPSAATTISVHRARLIQEGAVTWIPEELDPESDQIREVYAKYGVAMYYAQVLEHGLANLIVGASLGTSIKTQEAWESLYDELFGMTMGNQIKRVLKEARLADTQMFRLRRALTTRNFSLTSISVSGPRTSCR